MSLKGSLSACYVNDQIFYYTHGETNSESHEESKDTVRIPDSADKILKKSVSSLPENKGNVLQKPNAKNKLNNSKVKNLSCSSSAVSVEQVTDFDCFPWKGVAAKKTSKKSHADTLNMKSRDVCDDKQHFVKKCAVSNIQSNVIEKDKNVVKKPKEIKRVKSAVTIEPLNQLELEHIMSRSAGIKLKDNELCAVSESSTVGVSTDVSLQNSSVIIAAEKNSSVNIAAEKSSDTLLTCDPSNNDNFESLSEDNESVFKFSKLGEMKWLEWCISKLKQEISELENMNKEHESKVETNIKKREIEIKKKIRQEENRLLWLEAKKREDDIKKKKIKELQEKENQLKLLKINKQSDIQKAYEKWLALKNIELKDKLQHEEKAREMKELEKSKRLEKSREVFEKWLQNSKQRIKPESGAIIINQVGGIYSGAGSDIFENPNPWKSTLDIES